MSIVLEITDKTLIDKILTGAEVIRLAMIDNESPYLFAMNYAYVGNCIYMHYAKEYPEKALEKTLVIKVEIESMTVNKSGY